MGWFCCWPYGALARPKLNCKIAVDFPHIPHDTSDGGLCDVVAQGVCMVHTHPPCKPCCDADSARNAHSIALLASATHLSFKLGEVSCEGIENVTRNITASPCAARCLHVVVGSRRAAVVPYDATGEPSFEHAEIAVVPPITSASPTATCSVQPISTHSSAVARHISERGRSINTNSQDVVLCVARVGCRAVLAGRATTAYGDL